MAAVAAIALSALALGPLGGRARLRAAGILLLLGHLTAPTLQRGVDLVLAPLAAAGSMTLTLYTAHIVFMTSPLDELDPTPGYVVQVVAAPLFAMAWRWRVGRGPLESLTARLSHRPAAPPTPTGRHAA